jgi:hypothetical protein
MTAQTARQEPTVDAAALEAKVKEMYRLVAEAPQGDYHFELGRPLADRLGYDAEVLNGIPVAAVSSFAGVGFVFGLAQLQPGERVIDLGSGSGNGCLVRRLAGRTEGAGPRCRLHTATS